MILVESHLVLQIVLDLKWIKKQIRHSSLSCAMFIQKLYAKMLHWELPNSFCTLKYILPKSWNTFSWLEFINLNQQIFQAKKRIMRHFSTEFILTCCNGWRYNLKEYLTIVAKTVEGWRNPRVAEVPRDSFNKDPNPKIYSGIFWAKIIIIISVWTFRFYDRSWYISLLKAEKSTHISKCQLIRCVRLNGWDIHLDSYINGF